VLNNVTGEEMDSGLTRSLLRSTTLSPASGKEGICFSRPHFAQHRGAGVSQLCERYATVPLCPACPIPRNRDSKTVFVVVMHA